MNAISVQHVSKQFHLHTQQRGYGTIKDIFSFKRRNKAARTLRALDDVSFEVKQGEVLGLIGRNGAGKSTLLKILARILRPSAGRVELRGRVGSLLEVGAGFHPELTGRENVFLSAALLGMTHAEIARRLDEIVHFSGVEQHLDEPVKHYSSGMYLRLAFAVAAHIEPEILLVDEVLAVGDAEFQKKCIQRIQDVGKRGQTVLLVSHNIETVLRLCPTALLLDSGRVAAFGPAEDVVATYLGNDGSGAGERRYPDPAHAPGDSTVRLRSLRVCSRAGATLRNVDIGCEFGIEVQYDVLERAPLFPSLIVYNQWWPLLWTTDTTSPFHGRDREPGRYVETAWIPANFMTAGPMRITACMHSFRPYRVHFQEPDAVTFQAIETSGGSRGQYPAYIEGATRPLLPWTSHIQEPHA